MQTFVPVADFVGSARALDYRRLGKQRVEAHQLLLLILGETERTGWRNHPAARMWWPWPDALAAYFNACVDEWVDRGYRNTMTRRIVPDGYALPDWWGGPIHDAHRATLLRKDPEFYGRYGWTVDPRLPMIWPTTRGE